MRAISSTALVVERFITTLPCFFDSRCSATSASVFSSPIGLALLIHDGEPVGVRVLGEADIGLRFDHLLRKIGEIFRERFRPAREDARHVAVYRGDFAAKLRGGASA